MELSGFVPESRDIDKFVLPDNCKLTYAKENFCAYEGNLSKIRIFATSQNFELLSMYVKLKKKG